MCANDSMTFFSETRVPVTSYHKHNWSERLTGNQTAGVESAYASFV